MNLKSLSGGRLALLATAIGLAVALVALPTAAFATTKATTRIVVVKNLTVDNGDPNVDPWESTSLSVKLQKKTSSGYKSLTGTVKMYWSFDGKTWTAVDSRRGSSLVFPIYGHGKLKFYYAGSSTTKSCAAYTNVWETVGDTFSLVENGITVESIPGSSPAKSMVSVRFNVNWNTNAWDGPVMVGFAGWLHDGPEDFGVAYSEQYREFEAPGEVEFNYKVLDTELRSDLHYEANPYVYDSYDPWILMDSMIGTLDEPGAEFHLIP